MKPGDAAVATAQSVEMASTDPGMVALALSDEGEVRDCARPRRAGDSHHSHDDLQALLASNP